MQNDRPDNFYRNPYVIWQWETRHTTDNIYNDGVITKQMKEWESRCLYTRVQLSLGGYFRKCARHTWCSVLALYKIERTINSLLLRLSRSRRRACCSICLLTARPVRVVGISLVPEDTSTKRKFMGEDRPTNDDDDLRLNLSLFLVEIRPGNVNEQWSAKLVSPSRNCRLMKIFFFFLPNFPTNRRLLDF